MSDLRTGHREVVVRRPAVFGDAGVCEGEPKRSTTRRGDGVEYRFQPKSPTGMGPIVKERYLRLMELVSYGYSWDEAAMLVDAPVSLACILETVAPVGEAAAAA
jgi:hypothetical protein